MNEIAPAQDSVFAWLAEAATHGGHPVKRIDTHAASLFLAGDRVLKVKRAVRFAFLDFTTLAKRKAACEAEIAVNRPFAPELYRGVVAITRAADGALSIGGSGEPVEWAVEMRRFDETRTLDHLADQGTIDDTLAEALGRVVADAHAAAAVAQPQPWIDSMGAYIDEHVGEFARSPDLFRPAEVDEWARDARALLARVRPLLIERGECGLIRRIHGDLHLGNIVLIDDRPVLFDAIEFSTLIGSGDLLYDLAFLLMDLCDRGLARAANIVFNTYFARSRRPLDIDALAALPFYLSMRAAIRAKVTAERRERGTESEAAALAERASDYFRLARRALVPPAPVLITVGGRSGTGKSVLARALAPGLAPMPGALVLRSDAERKALFGQNEHERLPKSAYAAEPTLRIYATIVDKARQAIAAGHSAIVDAVFAMPQERILAEQSAAALGAGFRGVFLQAPLATRLERIGGRRHDISDADAAVARAQEAHDLGQLDWAQIDAAGAPDQTLRLVEQSLH